MNEISPTQFKSRTVYVDPKAYNELRSLLIKRQTNFSEWIRNKIQAEIDLEYMRTEPHNEVK